MHHACGHDAHTAMLLCAISEISKRREELKRTIIFCFQPGEEGHKGAQKVFEAYPNLLEGVQHCFAIHAAGHLLKGRLGISKTYATANSTRFQVSIRAKSCHVMTPEAGIDANRIGCQLISHLYTINSQISLKEPAALAIYKVEGGNGSVAISDNFNFRGSLRCFSMQTYQTIRAKIEDYSQALCKAEGAQVSLDFPDMHYRAVKNDPVAIEQMEKAAEPVMD